jgi:hypothetical protein
MDSISPKYLIPSISIHITIINALIANTDDILGIQF